MFVQFCASRDAGGQQLPSAKPNSVIKLYKVSVVGS